MGFIADIFNLEVGLAVRNKLNFLMKFYNALAVSDGSFNLLRINASFVKDALPTTTKYLRDDGTWQAINANQTLSQTLANGNILENNYKIRSYDNESFIDVEKGNVFTCIGFAVGTPLVGNQYILNTDLHGYLGVGTKIIVNSPNGFNTGYHVVDAIFVDVGNDITYISSNTFVDDTIGATTATIADYSGFVIHSESVRFPKEIPSKIAAFDVNGNLKSGSKSIAELITDISNSEINANAYADGLIASLVGTSPVTLDTLEEITTALQNNPNVISEILTALGNRVKFDVNNQGLSVMEKLNARTNIGLDAFDATAITNALASKYNASNPNNYETPAQLNARDTTNRNRANHSGTQLASTISDFQATVTANTDVAANTVARHTHSNISILNAITEAFTTLLKTGYDNAVSWISTNGSNLINHLSNTANPHNTTASQVGLGNVDNTSDANKPISTATQTALNNKQDILVSATNIKTINGSSILGAGDLVISGGSGSPAGATTQLQYNNAGAFGGMSRVETDGDDLIITPVDAPAVPLAGKIKIVAKTIANRIFPSFVGSTGDYTVMQPFTGYNTIGLWCPSGNTTTVPGVFGIPALMTVGTATTRNITTTNLLTRSKRIAYVSAATAGALSSLRIAALQYTTGNGSGLGGFTLITRFAAVDAVVGARMFVGMSSNSAAATNVEPSTLLNSVGICKLSTDDTQLYICYGGTTAQTPIATGIAVNFLSLYELSLFSPTNATGIVHWTIKDLSANTSQSGTITGGATILPIATTLLTYQAWRCNNATASAVTFELASIYIEKQN